jgi:hypothetical protein
MLLAPEYIYDFIFGREHYTGNLIVMCILPLIFQNTF